jgi:hypothetical protein
MIDNINMMYKEKDDTYYNKNKGDLSLKEVAENERLLQGRRPGEVQGNWETQSGAF